MDNKTFWRKVKSVFPEKATLQAKVKLAEKR